ncbi:MAG TPA: fibronectin type III domain-containing protein [Bacillota bacterium]|nr:fibronectin type III domain-containing protein [Bacillota bacterium]
MPLRAEGCIYRTLGVLMLISGISLFGSGLGAGQELPPIAELQLVLESPTLDFGPVKPGVHQRQTSMRVLAGLPWRLLADCSRLEGVAVAAAADGSPWTSPLSPEPHVVLDDQPATIGQWRQITLALQLSICWTVPPGIWSLPVTWHAAFTDRTPPTVVAFAINGGAAFTRFPQVTLDMVVEDPSGVGSMRFGQDALPFGDWLNFASSAPYTLSGGDGLRRVTAQFRDRAGNVTDGHWAEITLDTMPPAITGVTAVDVGTTSATVIWTTDEPASSQVEYGLTIAYGLLSPMSPGPVTAHSVTITGLASGTIYHYRARSIDRAGNEALSGNFQLATALEPPPDLQWDIKGGSPDVRLEWDPSPSPRPITYRIWRRDVQAGETDFAMIATVDDKGRLHFHDKHVLPDKGLPYHLEYRVTAFRTGHPESVPSNTVTVQGVR